jgi:hypothetical protein
MTGRQFEFWMIAHSEDGEILQNQYEHLVSPLPLTPG